MDTLKCCTGSDVSSNNIQVEIFERPSWSSPSAPVFLEGRFRQLIGLNARTAVTANRLFPSSSSSLEGSWENFLHPCTVFVADWRKFCLPPSPFLSNTTVSPLPDYLQYLLPYVFLSCSFSAFSLLVSSLPLFLSVSLYFCFFVCSITLLSSLSSI